MIARILDNNLITGHRNHILVFDLEEGESKPEVQYVCDISEPKGSAFQRANYQFSCTGAHKGGPISLIVFNIARVNEEHGYSVDWDRIEWADDRTKCEDALVLDAYQDLIVERIREIMNETWD